MATVIVANLWAKQLIVGDIITDIEPIDTRYGELKLYTVERTEEAHAAEVARVKAEKERAKLDD
jgi:hypothetical protein